MGERILTDSRGGRWDVADAEGGERLQFTNPRGERYEVSADRRVDQLTDADLIRMLDDARAREGRDPVGKGGGGGAPGGGY